MVRMNETRISFVPDHWNLVDVTNEDGLICIKRRDESDDTRRSRSGDICGQSRDELVAGLVESN